jgi:hypothetical protein
VIIYTSRLVEIWAFQDYKIYAAGGTEESTRTIFNFKRRAKYAYSNAQVNIIRVLVCSGSKVWATDLFTL